MVFFLDLDYTFSINTTRLDEQGLHAELLDILSILAANNVRSVTMLFGDNWGMDHRSYIPFEIRVQQIPHEILKAEFRNLGSLGKDELLLQLDAFEMAILFSRDNDVQLHFDHRNDIVAEILNDWSAKKLSLSRNTVA